MKKLINDELKKAKLKKVDFARETIKSNLFIEEQITEICNWLGFNDTGFRDKSSEGKLKDFLLNKKYWETRLYYE